MQRRRFSYVVIELKVSRGYDRVIGQLLRYMGWVQKNMESIRPVRGMIVANEITNDLKLAALRMPDVRLIEYKLSFELNPV
jgi:RecB family endonuclease NucS